MRLIVLALLPLSLLAGACAKRSPESAIVADAAAALGGDRVAAARTLVVEGEGTAYNLGQDLTPGARTQTYAITGYRQRIDLAGPRMRVDQTRTPTFVYYAGQQPQALSAGLDGDVAFNIAPNGDASRAAESVATDRRIERLHHPVVLVRAARETGARLANARTEGGERLVDIVTADGIAATLAIDAASARPTRIVSRASHPNLGDVQVTTRFSDYRATGGATLPMRWTVSVDDFVTTEMTAASATLDADAGDLSAPAAARSGSAAPPAVVVSAEELAPGVWRLAGGSHHSALIDMKDSLMLVEAPLSEARTLAVIAKARELRPGKPLTAVISTHHHFDHTAGIRAAVAEGLAVVTEAGNAAFMEEIVKRPHTIAADTLARKPAPLALDLVNDVKTVDDGTRRVMVYHVVDNPHSHTMLMVHLPKERLLIEVDAFTPGAAVSPYAPNLLENIRRRKLSVDRVVSLHGSIVPFSQLEAVAAAAAR